MKSNKQSATVLRQRRVEEALADFERVERGEMPFSDVEKITSEEEVALLRPAMSNRHIGRDRLAHIGSCKICQARIIAEMKGDMAEGTIVTRFSD